MNNKKHYFSTTLLLILCTLFNVTTAFAHDHDEHDAAINTGILDQCQYPTLATNLLAPAKFGTDNTSICVDVPVNLNKVKNLFNMDTDTVDGSGNSIGLKHMVMLGLVIKDRISKGLMDPDDVSIIGVIHGSAVKWALKTIPAQQKMWMERIFALKKAGVNIQLEVCGVTLNGMGKTKADVYTYDANGNPDPNANGRIYVNQGAIAREIYLQQHGYTYINESYEDHD